MKPSVEKDLNMEVNEYTIEKGIFRSKGILLCFLTS